MGTHNQIIESNTYAKPADSFTEMLEGMTKPELVKYARMTYNLSVNAKYNKPDLIAAIRDAAAKFKVNTQFQTAAAIEDSGLKPGYSEIQLHRTELTKGLRTAIVGVNGHMASLPIGVRFGCPNEVVAVLNNAVRFEYEKNPDTDELEERQVHSYPFTVFASREHTPESAAVAARQRGFKGRPPREQWDESYAARLKAAQAFEMSDEDDDYDDE